MSQDSHSVRRRLETIANAGAKPIAAVLISSTTELWPVEMEFTLKEKATLSLVLGREGFRAR
jgi:hypothetical protein